MLPLAEKTLRVRPATSGDADAIAEIHVQGYEEAYRGLVPDEVIDSRTPELRRRVWGERLREPQADGFVLVAEMDGRVAGFSSGRPATAEEAGDEAPAGCWENLYVRPEVVGSGNGMMV